MGSREGDDHGISNRSVVVDALDRSAKCETCTHSLRSTRADRSVGGRVQSMAASGVLPPLRISQL